MYMVCAAPPFSKNLDRAAVGGEGSVGGDESKWLRESLGQQQAIERVGVVHW